MISSNGHIYLKCLKLEITKKMPAVQLDYISLKTLLSVFFWRNDES